MASNKLEGTQFGCAVGGTVGSIHLDLRSLGGAGHVNLKRVRGKVALAFGGCRYHGARELLSDDLAQAAIAEEEESLVMLHRAADDSAKLVAMVRRVEGRIPGDGIEGRVAVELKQRAMDLVGSRLRDCGDHGARHPAILSREIAGFHTKFLQRVRVGQRVAVVAQTGHVAAAVQVEADHRSAAVDAAVDDDLCRR